MDGWKSNWNVIDWLRLLFVSEAFLRCMVLECYWAFLDFDLAVIVWRFVGFMGLLVCTRCGLK